MDMQVEAPIAPPKPARPKRRKAKRRAAPRVVKLSVPGPGDGPVFKGLGEGAKRCAYACTRECCVITQKGSCGWPSLQASDARDSAIVARYKEAKLYFAMAQAEKKAKR